ncbi:transcriptional regulator, TetR family [Candidatus Koribacter versatilis Ellin345]|uniref:Transcriptional regulator, TetR family n=1 Tax=Koribacter versatilis (strain Ellin345) TaxID=204669 RepID=Q1IKD6_KORVE|nr:TetR/AcrR family transcriptional regulator [Candidatus Koribacter versatilis]ABF42664.1 transcriptional regulator, TetR family [Candidatus Koribacter versatilis Ellin345]
MSNSERAKPSKASSKSVKATDARIRRTHERLGLALIELILDNPIDTVTVQDVLDRAGVGRSTFYLHYRDKDDLLWTQLEQFFEIMSNLLDSKKEVSRRVLPVREMLEHVGIENKIYRALADSGRLHDFFDLAQQYFARSIEKRLSGYRKLLNISGDELTARANALAGSYLALMRWWIDSKGKLPPQAVDDLFHGMVWKGLE